MFCTEPRAAPPNTRFAAVLIGRIAWSSSLAVADEPAAASVPTTCMGTPETATVAPTGSRPPNSCSAVLAASTTTAAWAVMSWLVRKRPDAILRARTDSQSGVVPTTVVVQFDVPAVSDRLRWLAGATAAMSGATSFEARASASCTVRVEAEPKPPRTPSLLVALPGVTTSRLLPRELIWSRTWFWVPWPRPTVRMTAAMPMRIPRTVRAERDRCVRTASMPMRSVSSQLMGGSPR